MRDRRLCKTVQKSVSKSGVRVTRVENAACPPSRGAAKDVRRAGMVEGEYYVFARRRIGPTRHARDGPQAASFFGDAPGRPLGAGETGRLGTSDYYQLVMTP